MKIQPYTHRCVVRSGPARGNENWHDVSAYEVECAEKCSECGEVLATPGQIAAYIYDQLLGDS